jgi:hypothetical protein
MREYHIPRTLLVSLHPCAFLPAHPSANSNVEDWKVQYKATAGGLFQDIPGFPTTPAGTQLASQGFLNSPVAGWNIADFPPVSAVEASFTLCRFSTRRFREVEVAELQVWGA